MEIDDVFSYVMIDFRIMTIYLKPIIPSYVQRVEELFGEEAYNWKSTEKVIESGTLNPFAHLLQRIDPKHIDAMIEETKAAAMAAESTQDTVVNENVEPIAEEINVDDFFKVDLRVAKIIKADHVKGANKLLQLTLDIGAGQRNVFAGIKSAYTPEELEGRLVMMVANLKPRKMKFGMSEGMVCAAGPGGKDIFLLSPDSGATPGMRIG